MHVELHACVTSVRDDVGLRRARLDIGGRMRSLGESGERGMDQDQDERCEKETDEMQSGESATQRAHRTLSRHPDSNIVLGIGRSASLSEPAGFGAISHKIHTRLVGTRARQITTGTTRNKIEHVKRCIAGNERSEFTSAKNGSAIDRKPSAGHYCVGLLSGLADASSSSLSARQLRSPDDTDDGMHSGLISVVKLPRTRASGLFDADNSRGRRRSSSSPSSSSHKLRGEQVHQMIVFSQWDRKWRVDKRMLRIVKRTSERQSNNGTDVYIAICFSCSRVQRGKIDFELGQSIERQLLEEFQVAISLIVTTTSLVPSFLPKSKQHHGEGQPENFPCCSAVAEKSGAGMTAVQQGILFRGRAPEQDRNEPFCLAIFTYRGSVLSTTRVSNEEVLRDVEVPSRIRPTEVRQHGENLKRLKLKSQLEMRRDTAGRKSLKVNKYTDAFAIYEKVNPGSKAAQQGVREGDLISNINERSTRDLTNSEAHALLRNSGEQLKLGLNQENIGSPKRRIYRSSLQENTTTEIQNSRDHHKDHNDNAHTDGVGEERCHLFGSSDDWIITSLISPQRMTCTDHKCTRIIPLWLLLPGSFLQIARSSSRYNAHPDRGIPTPCVECACVLFTHTRNTPVPGSHVHSHVYERTPATTTTRCNSVRAHPWLSGKTLHRGGDPLLLLFFLRWAAACGPTFLVQYQGTLCRACRAEQSSFKVAYFEKKHRNREDFRLFVIEDRGSIA
ncbi:hypothetical protein G5I_01837 [Acromyrmex echinatior]|uniref:PDZ domain-containing protein n=1 Tax=Acromyrmex echinatior TaxID=103372 RepID=F4W8Q5_ACREC|nr:hypothetical protein G5I_01837 [Acromyrmex echinatior]